MNLLSGCEAVFGRINARLAAAAVGVGGLTLVAALATGRREALFSALAVCALYFGGISAGGVAISATVKVVRGHWASAMLPAAEAGASCLGPAVLVLAAAMAGARYWMPWAARASNTQVALVAGRDIVASGAIFMAGIRFRRAGREAQHASGFALVFIACYVIALSILAFDMAMSLYEGEPSTIEPALYFMGALLAGLAGATLVSNIGTVRDLDANSRHDAGKLLFAFATFWSYLVWSAYLPVWYGNMPGETAFLLARVDGSYRLVSIFTMLAIVLIPAFVLFTEKAKRNALVLRVIATLILVGVFGECVLLVCPDTGLAGPADASVFVGISAGVAGAFLLIYGASAKRVMVALPAPQGG